MPVSMPWKAGESLLQKDGKLMLFISEACLNALESGRVIVTDPILEAGGSKARKPRIANPLS